MSFGTGFGGAAAVPSTTAAGPSFRTTTTGPFGGSGATLPSSSGPWAMGRAGNAGNTVPILNSNQQAESKLNVLRPASEAPLFGAATVTFLVGPKEEPVPYTIHETLVRRESEFVEAIFRNGWKEAEERTIHLPEHDSESFKVFFGFVYARRIFSGEAESVSDNLKPDGPNSWHCLAQAYALGSYLQAGDFNDAVTDAVVQLMRSCRVKQQCTHTIHTIIYPNSKPGSGVRRLLVDIASYDWLTSHLQSLKTAPEWSDFFLELSVALHIKQSEGLTRPPYVEGTTCIYHDHGSERPCYRL